MREINRAQAVRVSFDLNDRTLICAVLREEYERVPSVMSQSFGQFLNNESFALGYFFGFLEQASREVHGQTEKRYVSYMLEALLADPKLIAPYMSFASFQRHDVLFQKGYEDGVLDLLEYADSNGRRLPGRLVTRYNVKLH